MLEGEQIKLTFVDFSLEYEWDCWYDYVVVSVN